MNYQHKNLAAGRWNQFSLIEQLANIGAEVGRAVNWRTKNNPAYSQMAFEQALELADLTIADPKNRHRLREVCRMRELLVDYFFGDNIYKSDDNFWQKYFYSFNYAARLAQGTLPK